MKSFFYQKITLAFLSSIVIAFFLNFVANVGKNAIYGAEILSSQIANINYLPIGFTFAGVLHLLLAWFAYLKIDGLDFTKRIQTTAKNINSFLKFSKRTNSLDEDIHDQQESDNIEDPQKDKLAMYAYLISAATILVLVQCYYIFSKH